jgi:hypothetical protein
MDSRHVPSLASGVSRSGLSCDQVAVMPREAIDESVDVLTVLTKVVDRYGWLDHAHCIFSTVLPPCLVLTSTS